MSTYIEEIRFEADPPPFIRIEAARMTSAEVRPTQYVLAQVIPRGVVTLLGGHGGAGKSVLALEFCAHVAAGRAFAEMDAAPGRALFVSLEDPGDVVLFRLRRICEAFGLSTRAVAENLSILDGSDSGATLAQEYAHDGVRNIAPTAAMQALEEAAAGSDLIVVDNASDAFGGNENDRRQVRGFVRALARIAKRNNSGLVLLAHIDKQAARFGAGGNSYSGSTAWHNSARSRLAVLSEGEAVELHHEKAQFGPKRAPLRLNWSDAGVLLPAGAGVDQSAAQAESDAADAVAVLGAIREAIGKGATVRTGRTGSNTTRHVLEAFPDALPKQMKGSAKAVKDRFWRAVDACQRHEWIEREEFEDTYRHRKERFVVTPAGAAVLDGCGNAAHPHTPSARAAALPQGAGCGNYSGTSATAATAADAYRAARGEA